MWEAAIICKSCELEHLVAAVSPPRSFRFTCPKTGETVDMPYRDPSRMERDWSEVETASPNAVTASLVEVHGSFDL